MAGPLHSTRASNIGARTTGTDVLTPAVLVREGLYRLTNRLVVATLCRRYTDEIFGYNVTAGICYIKKPFYMKLPTIDSDENGGRTLKASKFQEVSDEMLEVEIDQRERIGFTYYDIDKTLSIVDFTTRYVQSGIEELAERVEEVAVAELAALPNYCVIETGSTDEFNAKTTLKARAYSEDQSIPADNNYLIINPTDYIPIADDLRGVAVGLPEGTMMSSIVTSHYKGMLSDYKVYTSNKIPHYSYTALTGTLVIHENPGHADWAKSSGGTGDDAIYNTLHVDGTTAGTLKKGTVFTISGLYERHIRGSRDATPRLFKFVCQSDTSSPSAGTTAWNIPVQPFSVGNPNAAGISKWPADGNAIVLTGTAGTNYNQQVFWHRDAMNMVAPSLVDPDGSVESGKAIDSQTGISMQYVKDYDITSGQTRWRVDTIFGFKMLRPELALRNFSKAYI